jgi:hypothetical protein
MNKLGCLIVILILLVSCHYKTESDISSVSLEGLWDSKDFVNLSEVAQSIEYIPLEKTPECILPGENMLSAMLSGDFLIVYTPYHPVYVFNPSGKFLFTLGNHGQGPGEFLSAKTEYDPVNMTFWILDSSQDKLLKFDHDGKYKDEYKLDDFTVRMAIRSDGQVFTLRLPWRTQPEKAEVQMINQDGKVERAIPLYQEREPGAGDYAAITAFFGFVNDTLYFNEGTYRAGYYLDINDMWQEAWKMDQGKNALDDEAYFGSGDESFLTGPAVVKVQETETNLFIYGRKEGLSKYFVHFKNQNLTKSNHILAETENTMDIYGMFNDIDGGLPFWPSGHSANNQFVQLNDAQRYMDLSNGLLKYYGTEKIAPVSDELLRLCATLKLDDNPVAMLVRLKAQGSRLR